MSKITIILITIFIISFKGTSAQYGYVQEGEFGITAGVTHYFGDLNNRGAINRPKLSLGAYYRKQFGYYTGLRLGAHFAQLGYSDIYSKNDFQHRRNLSFNTNIWELALQGDFNFFRFNPSGKEYNFTPYITLGIGVFGYNPYAFNNGEKIFLRPLNTEGQTFYQSRKVYGTMAICFPIGGGIKYSLNDKINLSFEISHRFTSTDYIDDVSTTYVGADKFPSQNGQPSLAAILQDRSFETGEPIGVEGRQRGWSKQKDQYIFAEFGLSLNLSSYHCPSPK